MTASPLPIEPSASSSSVDPYVFVADPRVFSPQDWDIVSPFLQPAIDQTRGETSAEVIRDAIRRCHAMLWVVCTKRGGPAIGAMVTRILRLDNGSEYVLIQLAGAVGMTFDQMRYATGVVELFARVNRCVSVRIYGRKGWAKVLHGYGQPFTVLEKEL